MFEVKQHEWLTINFRDAFERTPENRQFFIADGLFGWQWFRRMGFGTFFERFGAIARLAAVFAQRIVDYNPRDAAKPRAQFFLLPQTGTFLPRGEESVLRQITHL